MSNITRRAAGNKGVATSARERKPARTKLNKNQELKAQLVDALESLTRAEIERDAALDALTSIREVAELFPRQTGMHTMARDLP